MNRISLRWRITILMGVLVLSSSVLLTIFSIHNATNNFVIPLVHSSAYVNETNMYGKQQNPYVFSLDENPSDLPGGVVYKSEINLDIKNAQQSFSVSSFLYMALITVGSMIVAYYLAGKAMCPITKINNEIELIDGNTLSKRINVPQTKDEIENLSLSFNKLLERLEREFERERRFSANAAHELKTPLATIITSAQVLKLSDEITLEEYRENLDITLQSARRLSDVVEGLLMLYRTERQVSFDTVNISQMFYGIQKEIEPLYFEKHILTKYDLNIDTLRGNQLLLYRAFFNLVENAYKYTEKNGTITITSYRKENENIICISDTGIGIPADDIEHIFEPFYRADKSRSRKISGAGLGLAITREIFDLHKACITINSLQNNGTIVEVRFKK